MISISRSSRSLKQRYRSTRARVEVFQLKSGTFQSQGQEDAMSLKENLKKKILIDRLSRIVAQSIGSPGSARKIDKENMRKLLSLSSFVLEKRRDLELYFRELEPGMGEIVSLDNELPLYGKTTIEDVALRRSPEVKEMVSIRNIIKILNDKDIRLCKGTDTVCYVHDRALELFDLSITEKDVQEMIDDGIDAFARGDSEAVLEILELFFELLGYDSVPAAVLANDYVMFGDRHAGGDARESFGTIIMYNDKRNLLRLIKQTLLVADPVSQTLITGVALGDVEPGAEGHQVFWFLKEAALKKEKPTIH